MSSDSRVIADDDPTAEEKTLAVDSGRPGNPPASDRVSVASTSGNSAGSIDYDDRGDARWRWVTESTPISETDKTFDHLKALANDALSLEESRPSAGSAKPSRKTGYNPYDVGDPVQPKPRK